jgi:hypothetical protein
MKNKNTGIQNENSEGHKEDYPSQTGSNLNHELAREKQLLSLLKAKLNKTGRDIKTGINKDLGKKA